MNASRLRNIQRRLGRDLIRLFIVTALLLALFPATLSAASSEDVSLAPLLPDGQVVGTTIPWIAVTKKTATSRLRYRFRVGTTPYTLSIARDYSPENNFRWTPMAEGTYTIEVSVWDLDSNQLHAATAEYRVRSRINGIGENAEPVLSATSHPLVFLYSAPPCDAGRMRIRFRLKGAEDWQVSYWKQCQSNISMNFYVAGMQAQKVYEVQHELDDGAASGLGPLLSRRTGALEMEMPRTWVRNLADAHTSQAEGVLLQSINGGPVYDHVFPLATDLAGNVIWYYRFRDFDSPVFPWHAGEYLLRTLPGGNLLMFLNYRGEFDQILREIDLAGHPVRETNVEQINRQLVERGEDTIGYLHHEAVAGPDGHILILGSVERIVEDVQGEGLVDVLGDMVIALDKELQVSWTWNPFEHLDVSRMATLGEVCTNVTVGCPPLSKATEANDWTHANTIALAQDGNLLLSLRNQDWIIKIDAMHGTGKVLWRLGKDGDFVLDSDAESPWFSHQHDIFLVDNTIAVYDNGNTRCESLGNPCNSRGQVYEIDEDAMTARLILNADLGGFSTAFGSAQGLSNGNYHFLSGIVLPRVVSHSIEVNHNGRIVYWLETEGSQYRSFRMTSMYEPAMSELASLPRNPFAARDRVYMPLVR